MSSNIFSFMALKVKFYRWRGSAITREDAFWCLDLWSNSAPCHLKVGKLLSTLLFLQMITALEDNECYTFLPWPLQQEERDPLKNSSRQNLCSRCILCKNNHHISYTFILHMATCLQQNSCFPFWKSTFLEMGDFALVTFKAAQPFLLLKGQPSFPGSDSGLFLTISQKSKIDPSSGKIDFNEGGGIFAIFLFFSGSQGQKNICFSNEKLTYKTVFAQCMSLTMPPPKK